MGGEGGVKKVDEDIAAPLILSKNESRVNVMQSHVPY